MTDARTPATTSAVENGSAGALFGLGLAVIVGTLVRLVPSVGAEFPLNDGGLFTTMIEDLVGNGLLLPASTTYNGEDIPFAYPPLALYIAAIANSAFGIPVVDLLRALPLVFSVLMIPALYWVAHGILGSRTGAALAAIAFALLPRSYQWMITGGGITRSLGFLLALIAIGIAWRFLRSREHQWWVAIALGLVGGLTALAHPQAAFFMALSIVVFLPWADGWQTAAVRVAVAGLIGFLAILPWLAALVGTHGFDPLMSAFGTGGGATEGVFNLLSYRFTGMVLIDVIGIVALIGVVIAIRRRELLLPVWLVVILVLDSRAGATFAMVPVALLAASAVGMASSAWLPEHGESPIRFLSRHRWRTVGSLLALLALIFANTLSAIVETSPLHALSSAQRQAMVWTSESTATESRFAVVTGGPQWERDAVSEWFPTLAGRMSVATVQGFEWLGRDAWTHQQAAYDDLQDCAHDVLPCVLDWASAQGDTITHVYLPSGYLHGALSDPDCCPAPRHSVEMVDGARVVYDGPGATIIELP